MSSSLSFRYYYHRVYENFELITHIVFSTAKSSSCEMPFCTDCERWLKCQCCEEPFCSSCRDGQALKKGRGNFECEDCIIFDYVASHPEDW